MKHFKANWIRVERDDEDEFECPCCGWLHDDEYNYCHNCGIHMDGETELILTPKDMEDYMNMPTEEAGKAFKSFVEGFLDSQELRFRK